jgi:hypothetical protein
MNGLPDPEIEGDLEPSLLLAAGGRHLDVHGHARPLSVALAERGDAVGMPKVAEELLDQVWIAELDDHLSHCPARIPRRQVGTCGSGRLARLGSWRC